MADNTILNLGAGGDTIATEDIGGVKHELIKVEWGGAGVANKTDDASGKRLPVKMAEGLSAASVISNQLSLSGAAAALSSAVARRFKLKADNDNTDKIFIGTAGVTTGTGYPLSPGDMMTVEVSNLNIISAIVGSGTQLLHYFGEV